MRRSSARCRRGRRAGCGAEEFPNEPRPPAPVELSAKVDDHNVVVVPDDDRRRAATITISNQSDDDVQLDFNGPTNAQIARDPGRWGRQPAVSRPRPATTRSSRACATIGSTRMVIGPERASAKNILLLP